MKHDKYSRQTLALGEETMESINNGTVFVHGNSYISIEILKNLILMGVGNVLHVSDNCKVSRSDVKNCFIYEKEDKNKNVKQVLYDRLSILNPNVNYKEIYPKQIHEGNHVHILENNTRYDLLSHKNLYFNYNDFNCVIYSQVRDHIIKDIYGEELKSGIVISSEYDDKKNVTKLIVEKDHGIYQGANINGYNVLHSSADSISVEGMFTYNRYKEEPIEQVFNYNQQPNNLPSKPKTKQIFPPMISIVGGILSQEAVKLLSCKTVPIESQYFDFSEFKHFMDIDCRPFIVGSGAIGCELLKNLSMLGFDCSITDMDTIEMSNLSRQYLFQAEDIGNLKSKTAAHKMKKINVKAYSNRVGKENEEVFDENFYKGHSVILNALDNVEARIYMDEISVKYDLPLFDSGTLGTKCHVQSIIPYKTETYTDSVDPPIKETPMCTVRNFPNNFTHCVQYSRNEFETEVTDSKEYFKKLFDDNIVELLEKYPKDHIVDGELFWKLPKIIPDPIKLDMNNPNHTRFIELSDKLLGKKNDFDKDNELHAEYVHVMSIIRSSNYNIEPKPLLETRRIAGNIIPALASTTAVVSGLVTLELLRYLIKGESNNWTCNLSNNMYLMSETMPPIKNPFSKWDKYIYEVPNTTTISELVKTLYDKYEIDVYELYNGETRIYSDSEIDDNDYTLKQLRIKELSIVGDYKDEMVDDIPNIKVLY